MLVVVVRVTCGFNSKIIPISVLTIGEDILHFTLRESALGTEAAVAQRTIGSLAEMGSDCGRSLLQRDDCRTAS